ncbi:uncharacterized protein LOC135392083 isoform X1 [Ornithodoros turicata]|uniref:uncharacterized protein LOC135392083 isoform X1 n=1 Tax=Ornithodoros turicata TaxID=34597 RepID=UPI003139B8D7
MTLPSTYSNCFRFSILWTLPLLVVGYEYQLSVTNDGPAILDSTITFTAEVVDAPQGIQLSYIFRHNVPGPEPKEHEVRGGRTGKLQLTFVSTEYRSGVYDMEVDAYKQFFFTREKVAVGSCQFKLSRDIVGKIVINQDGQTLPDDQTYLSTNKTTKFTFELHDPSGFFDKSSNSLAWKMDHGVSHYAPSLEYNFTDTKPHVVSLVVVALVSKAASPGVKIGSFSREVSPMDPITAVQVDGKLWLRHGDVVSLQVSCNGSSPYSYCWKYFPGNTTSQDTANLTCDEPVTTNICQFPVVHYFPQDGAYIIAIIIKNIVQQKPYVKNMEVHIYDVSHKGLLSSIVLPITCSLMAIVILVTGAAYHVHTRGNLHVEVADFDFQHGDLNLVEQTFWKRLLGSCRESCLPSRGSPSLPEGPLIDPKPFVESDVPD